MRIGNDISEGEGVTLVKGRRKGKEWEQDENVNKMSDFWSETV